MPGDLYYGDNLDVLRHKVASESVDLIYLDPPFNSDRTYNLIHKDSQAQQHVFVDTWHWEDSAERAFAELTGHAPQGVRVPQALSGMMRALKEFLWENQRDTLAYLSMMAIRLVEMHRVLRTNGSLYLHCDPTASHYLKMILDSIFGSKNFQNEIIWKRAVPKSDFRQGAKNWPRVHDVLLSYGKDASKSLFRQLLAPYSDRYIAEKYSQVDSTGRRYQLTSLNAPGAGTRGHPRYELMGVTRFWRYNEEKMRGLIAAGRIIQPGPGKVPRYKRYLDEMSGVPVGDVWEDIPPVNSQAEERLGYQTQKPTALLERVIAASSNEGDLVLDPFCGCGTTVEAAEKLGRKWIGIDVAIRAIDVIKDRLDEKFQPRVWTEYGEPGDVDGAAHLAETNPYDFQWWAVRRLGGQPPRGEKKKGGDGGIDGEMTLRDFAANVQRRVIISVKGGHTLTPEMVKGLESTVRLEKADFGILVTMHSPSAGMRALARDFGTVGASPRSGKLEHRIRIITVPEIIAGTVQLPGLNITPRTHSSPPPTKAKSGSKGAAKRRASDSAAAEETPKSSRKAGRPR